MNKNLEINIESLPNVSIKGGTLFIEETPIYILEKFTIKYPGHYGNKSAILFMDVFVEYHLYEEEMQAEINSMYPCNKIPLVTLKDGFLYINDLCLPTAYKYKIKLPEQKSSDYAECKVWMDIKIPSISLDSPNLYR